MICDFEASEGGIGERGGEVGVGLREAMKRWREWKLGRVRMVVKKRESG